MFGSAPLDALIGMTLIFVALSIVCSAITECLSSWGKWRSSFLFKTVQSLLGKEGAIRFFNHESIIPLCRNVFAIQSLDPGIEAKRKGTEPELDAESLKKSSTDRVGASTTINLPSVLPGDVFAHAVIQLLSDGAGDRSLKNESIDETQNSLREKVVPLLGIGTKITSNLDFTIDIRKSLVTWYDRAMERTTGEYKRKAKNWLLILGFIIALVGNIDSIEIARYFLNNPTAREAVVKKAAELSTPSTQPMNNTQAAIDATLPILSEYGFPLGWQAAHGPSGWLAGHWYGWILVSMIKLAGIGSTAFAVSMGAPFWFDVMRNLSSLRNVGQTGETKPKDQRDDVKNESPSQPGSVIMAADETAVLPGFWNNPSRDQDADQFNAAQTGPLTLPNALFMAKCSFLAYSNRYSVDRLLERWKLTPCEIKQGESTQFFSSSNEKMLLVSFRGTEVSQLQDILADASFSLRSWRDLPGKMHNGFTRALDEVLDDLDARVEGELKNTNRKLWMTGHSLGGALATLYAAYRVLKMKSLAGVYTFGCPRVGNVEFCQAVNQTLNQGGIRIFNFVNDHDIVTRVPARLMGYGQIGSVCYMSPNGELDIDGPLWVRYLNTVLDAMTQFQKMTVSSFKDHAIALYVDRISGIRQISGRN